jgi:hypothetical protein
MMGSTGMPPGMAISTIIYGGVIRDTEDKNGTVPEDALSRGVSP